ncbi:MAG: GNAT family N-acetyltransferase [Rhodobacteraceae bacterium]|nr:GNAT family N-acetyltransferase [Paracoccaceae bacterium]
MITYRTATIAELSHVLEWAADEGWNPGLDDAEAFFAADPEGFFVAVDKSGTPIAAISVVNHAPDFAFLGLYLVRPTHRGKGIGLGLWQHAILHAEDRTIGLDGVEAQQENYRASGFVYSGGTTRFSGKVLAQHAPDIRQMRQDDIPMLIDLEAEASGVTKSDYLESWLSGTAARVTIVHENQDGVCGFCTVRACRVGAKIGPLIASDAAIAQKLVAHAATFFEASVTLDVPEASTQLTSLCTRLGLEAGFKTARMYRGNAVATNHLNYAVTSLELG